MSRTLTINSVKLTLIGMLSSAPCWAHAAATDTARPLFAQAFEQMKLNNVDVAIALFRRGLEIDGKNALANLLLGELLETKGDVDGAMAAYRAALATSARSSAENVKAEMAIARLQIDTYESAPAPDWHLGLSWTTKKLEGSRESYIQHLVTEIKGNDVLVTLTSIVGSVTSRGTSYITFDNDYPLFIGKKWDPSFGGLFTGVTPYEAEVLRSEVITTQMGRLHTFVVRTRTTDPTDKNATTITRWYAPKLGLCVKTIGENYVQEVVAISKMK